MSPGRILVIAPSDDFRHSLAFALETEGYVVTSLASLPLSAARGYDCVVLDHKAIRGLEPDAVLAFCRGGPHVVLLAGRPQTWLVREVYSLVPAPIIGESLSRTVRDAIDAADPRISPK